jgi:uncharacterized protein
LKITQETPTTVTIRSVSEREICIGNSSYRQTIAIAGGNIIDDWSEAPIAELHATHFDRLLASDPEVIVLGTGPKNIFPPRELIFALARRGVGLEFMDTPAAARTFNVLASEGRSVAAVLYCTPASG